MWLLRRRHIVGGGATVQGKPYLPHSTGRRLADNTEQARPLTQRFALRLRPSPKLKRLSDTIRLSRQQRIRIAHEEKLDILGWELGKGGMGKGTIPQLRILRLMLNTDFLSCVCHIMWSWSAMLVLILCDSDLAASAEESCRGSPFRKEGAAELRT